MLARTHGKGQGISMSFRGMGKSLPMGDQIEGPATTRKPLPTLHRNEFPVGYSLAGCSPAEPASASPTACQFNQGPVRVEKFSVNGTLSLNCLSHSRGQVQIVVPISNPEYIVV